MVQIYKGYNILLLVSKYLRQAFALYMNGALI